LRAPMVFALLGKFNVACETLAEDQCSGLSASAVLTGLTSLLPILDSELEIEVTDRTMGHVQRITLSLTGSQLLSKEASLSVVLPPCPRVAGTCTVHWLMAGRLLAQAELRVITPPEFQQSLYLAEGRFLSQGKEGLP